MKSLRLLLTIIFTLGLLGTSTSPVFAASLTVTKIADTNDGVCNSDCSLREAVGVASSGDTIIFNTSLSGETITLVSTLKLSKDVTIDGSALALPITISGVTGNDGTGDFRVFIVNSGIKVTLLSLTITKSNITGYSYSGGISIYNDAVLIINNCTISNNLGGNGGGIINWYGTLTIMNSTISNNSAITGGGIYSQGGTVTLTNVLITSNSATNSSGGIYNSSNLTITNSTVSNNLGEMAGGGINNGGSLTLTNSVVTGNSATQGGGIYNGGSLTLTDSTISENLGGTGGGGINNSGPATVTNSTLKGNSSEYGGGIHNTNTLTITNSTLFDNRATGSGGGINNTVGALTITNSTFSGNSADQGGGIYNHGTLKYSNTIIANSTGWGCYNYFSAIALNINNLVEDNVPNWVYGEDCGTPTFTSDSNLGLLANNGGPTQTMALLAGSSAINAGDNATCAASPINNFDQRGIARPEGNTCEIGAYEVDIPIIASVKRLDINPTLASSVNFSVAFSESVTGVDTGDFSLTTSGVSGATIITVGGSGSTYIVTVNTGSGNGTIRLDMPASASIVDLTGHSLVGLPFLGGQTYIISKPSIPKAPILRSPRFDTMTNNTPTFWWTDVTDGQTYEIEFATDNSFTTGIDSHIVSSSSYTVTVPFADGKYFWRVRAYNIINQAGAWSLSRTFTIDTTGPVAPVLSFPADNASTRRTPTFKWRSSPTAVSYEFQYDDDPDFSSPIYTTSRRITYTSSPAMRIGTYSWHVRAKDAVGNWGNWSAPFTVTITGP